MLGADAPDEGFQFFGLCLSTHFPQQVCVVLKERRHIGVLRPSAFSGISGARLESGSANWRPTDAPVALPVLALTAGTNAVALVLGWAFESKVMPVKFHG